MATITKHKGHHGKQPGKVSVCAVESSIWLVHGALRIFHGPWVSFLSYDLRATCSPPWPLMVCREPLRLQAPRRRCGATPSTGALRSKPDAEKRVGATQRLSGNQPWHRRLTVSSPWPYDDSRNANHSGCGSIHVAARPRGCHRPPPLRTWHRRS